MAIDRAKIISDLSQIKIQGDQNGLIDGFSVLIQQLPAVFWNSFAAKLTNAVDPEMLEPTEFLLINAAHECGYHTGYGIITSEEWKAVVAPMIEAMPEDVLRGAYAVFTAWGWGDAEIVELVPGEKMVVRARDYYEADIAKDGKVPRVAAYMIRGVSAAFMDLAYGGAYDPSGKTGMGTFACVQTKGIEMGDSYGEFVVTKVA